MGECGPPSSRHAASFDLATSSRRSLPAIVGLDFLPHLGTLVVMPHLSPPTLTESETRAILAATACNVRHHLQPGARHRSPTRENRLRSLPVLAWAGRNGLQLQ
jgi:hypothetical protein